MGDTVQFYWLIVVSLGLMSGFLLEKRTVMLSRMLKKGIITGITGASGYHAHFLVGILISLALLVTPLLVLRWACARRGFDIGAHAGSTIFLYGMIAISSAKLRVWERLFPGILSGPR
jgi:hypothetical protein